MNGKPELLSLQNNYKYLILTKCLLFSILVIIKRIMHHNLVW